MLGARVRRPSDISKQKSKLKVLLSSQAAKALQLRMSHDGNAVWMPSDAPARNADIRDMADKRKRAASQHGMSAAPRAGATGGAGQVRVGAGKTGHEVDWNMYNLYFEHKAKAENQRHPPVRPSAPKPEMRWLEQIAHHIKEYAADKPVELSAVGAEEMCRRPAGVSKSRSLKKLLEKHGDSVGLLLFGNGVGAESRFLTPGGGGGKGKKKGPRYFVALTALAGAASTSPAVAAGGGQAGGGQNGTTGERQAARGSSGGVRDIGGHGSGVAAIGGSGQAVPAGERAMVAAQEAAVLFWHYLKEEEDRWERCGIVFIHPDEPVCIDDHANMICFCYMISALHAQYHHTCVMMSDGTHMNANCVNVCSLIFLQTCI